MAARSCCLPGVAWATRTPSGRSTTRACTSGDGQRTPARTAGPRGWRTSRRRVFTATFKSLDRRVEPGALSAWLFRLTFEQSRPRPLPPSAAPRGVRTLSSAEVSRPGEPRPPRPDRSPPRPARAARGANPRADDAEEARRLRPLPRSRGSRAKRSPTSSASRSTPSWTRLHHARNRVRQGRSEPLELSKETRTGESLAMTPKSEQHDPRRRPSDAGAGRRGAHTPDGSSTIAAMLARPCDLGASRRSGGGTRVASPGCADG